MMAYMIAYLMKKQIILALLFFLSMFVFVVACDHGSRGIFAEIEEEEQIDRSSAGEYGYPTSFHKTTVGSEARYYVTAKRLFWRRSADNGRDWNQINLPSGYDIAVGVSQIVVGSNRSLVVALISSANGRSALYELRTGSDSSHSWGANLYRDGNNAALTAQIVALHALEGANSQHRLFVLSQRRTSSNLLDGHTLYYYHTAGTAAVDDDRLHELWNPVGAINDIDRITSGGALFLIFSDHTGLYCIRDSGAGGGAVSDFTLIDGNSVRAGNNQFEMRSLVVDAGEAVDRSARIIGGMLIVDATMYVSAIGEIYRYREPASGADAGAICNSANWKDKCSASADMGCWARSSYGDATYRYTDMAWYQQSNVARGIMIGVEDNGQREGGYREIPLDESVTTIASLSTINNPRGTNYTSVPLSTAATRSFFVDGNAIFALTNGRGLWRGVYSDNIPKWSWDLSR